jgi:hypothetical protein
MVVVLGSSSHFSAQPVKKAEIIIIIKNLNNFFISEIF